jgi:hypothetical protein
MHDGALPALFLKPGGRRASATVTYPALAHARIDTYCGFSSPEWRYGL